MTAMSHQEEQEKLTFGTEGLAARDELLLKSLIRLLAHRTQQQWCYANGPADLMIIGDAPGPIETRIPISPTQSVLYLAQNFGSQTPYLRLPVRSNELEFTLNNLGADIVRSRFTLRSQNAPALASENDELKLLKWPAAALVGTRERLQMTTVLAGTGLSLALLAERTGTDIQVCRAFVQELMKAGVLEGRVTTKIPAADVPLAASVLPPPKPDIISRIRARFGLHLPGAR